MCSNTHPRRFNRKKNKSASHRTLDILNKIMSKKASLTQKLSAATQAHISILHKFNPEEVKTFRTNLLTHYEKTQRDLPWRNIAKKKINLNEKGYAVWVSEVMLQQTQVATVIDYYNRWMRKWPNIPELAKANLEEVNTMWSGLGYYSRGKRLHLGAQEVMNNLDGNIPSNSTDLQKKLPGVGRYTAGAIASIAFNEVTGVVDGNVIRVLCRLREIGANSASNTVQDLLWELANTIVSPTHPGDFNQALMEFGALICVPKSPKCTECPLSSICKSYQRCNQKTKEQKPFFSKKKNNNQTKDIEDVVEDCSYCLPSNAWESKLGVTNFPRKEKKKAPLSEKYIAVVMKQAGKYLLTKRPETGLLAGLWEFPLIKIEGNETNELSRRCCEEMKSRFSLTLSAKSYTLCGDITHLFSHRHHTYHVFKANLTNSNSNLPDEHNGLCWTKQEDLDKVAITTAVRKILSLADGGSVKDSVKRKRLDVKTTSKQRKMEDFVK